MIAGLTEAGGGVFEFARGLCGTLCELGASVSVLGLESENEQESPSWQQCKPTVLRTLGPSYMRFPLCLSDSLKRTGANLAHVHGLWSGFSQATPRASV